MQTYMGNEEIAVIQRNNNTSLGGVIIIVL